MNSVKMQELPLKAKMLEAYILLNAATGFRLTCPDFVAISFFTSPLLFHKTFTISFFTSFLTQTECGH